MDGARDDGTITMLIERLKAGDESAVSPLWEHCFEPLVRFAAKRMKGSPRRAADEEDVAHSVMRSFCSGAMKGHFKELHDRDGLWALLLLMTRRKVVDYWRRETRARRGRGKVRGDSAFDSDENPAGFDGLPGPESLPQLFAVLDENLEELRDDTLRTVAILRLRGYELEEIAAALGVTARTVRRKLDVLHTEWSANAEASA